MDRAYKAADAVRIYATKPARGEHDAHPFKTVQLVPYSLHGFNYYKVNGRLFPAYLTTDGAAFVALDNPFNPEQYWSNRR